jgi:hypothetical protein
MELVEGHHRTELSRELGFEYIPARIHNFKEESITEAEFIYASNVARRHLEDFENVELAFEKLAVSNDTKQPGRARELLSSETGVSSATAARCLKIIEYGSEDIKQRCRTGKARVSKEYINIQKQQKRQQLLQSAKKSSANFTDKYQLYLGDFRDISIANSSIDCIFVDPPYTKEALPLWKSLGNFAMRVMKPGSSLVAIAGGYCLPEIIDSLREAGLRYNWFCYMKHAGATRSIYSSHVIVCGKAIIWFYKGDKLTDTSVFCSDFVESEAPDKSLQEWAQSAIEAEHFISRLTVENQLILDPFMGSGTTGIACLNLNRRFVGIELIGERFEVAKARLARHQLLEVAAK